MKIILNTLILLSVSSFSAGAYAHSRENTDKFHPYLENSRHLQVPQWEDKNWYVEDWTSQKLADDILKGFYKADILEDQIIGKDDLPVLVVGKNFYRLSGFDKRRVITLVDSVYGVTGTSQKGSFFLQDWKTHDLIGVFDQDGLRLH
jgi:hypothetical protein